jgi:hypothetical protein
MTLAPRVGWLLSYSYLWADDHRRGAEEGIKNRPCALVAATRRDGDRIVAIVTPVTHSPPADPETAIEIPAVTKARLGLDAQRSWIICNEANVFAWPGPDLRAAASHKPPSGTARCRRNSPPRRAKSFLDSPGLGAFGACRGPSERCRRRPIAADESWRFVSRQSPILAGEPAAVG